MGMKISSIAADLGEEAEGAWIDIAEWPGVRVKVRSINYKLFQNAREQRRLKMTKELGREPFSSEFGPVLNKLAATFLLLDWEGIDGDDEKPLNYSPEVAMEKMCDPAMRALAEQVIWAATRVGSRDAEFTVVAAKN